MKSPVIGPGSRVQDARRSRSTGRTGSGAFTAHLQTEPAEESPSVSAPAELMGLDAILALQETGAEPTPDRRQAARQHGEMILDRLEQIRSDILLGRLSSAQLATLAQQIRARPPQAGDEQLDAILGEIELRAEVELAKLRRTRGSSGD